MLKPATWLAVALACLGAGPAGAIDTHRPEVKRFIARVAKQDSFSKRKLRKILAQAQSQPAILEAMEKPAEKAKLWFEYRPVFVNEKRIQEGAEFWIAQRPELLQASERSGVAP